MRGSQINECLLGERCTERKCEPQRYLDVAVMEVETVQALAPLGLRGATAGHMFLHSLLQGEPYALSPALVQQLPPPQLGYISVAQEPLQLLNDDTFQSTW